MNGGAATYNERSWLKRIYCLFFGHRWLMCRFVWLVRKLIRSGELACFRPGTLIRIASARWRKVQTVALTPVCK